MPGELTGLLFFERLGDVSFERLDNGYRGFFLPVLGGLEPDGEATPFAESDAVEPFHDRLLTMTRMGLFEPAPGIEQTDVTWGPCDATDGIRRLMALFRYRHILLYLFTALQVDEQGDQPDQKDEKRQNQEQ